MNKERDSYLSEIKLLKEIISELPEENIIELISFKHRLKLAEDKLSEIDLINDHILKCDYDNNSLMSYLNQNNNSKVGYYSK
jgi:hypothetical protein